MVLDAQLDDVDDDLSSGRHHLGSGSRRRRGGIRHGASGRRPRRGNLVPVPAARKPGEAGSIDHADATERRVSGGLGGVSRCLAQPCVTHVRCSRKKAPRQLRTDGRCRSNLPQVHLPQRSRSHRHHGAGLAELDGIRAEVSQHLRDVRPVEEHEEVLAGLEARRTDGNEHVLRRAPVGSEGRVVVGNWPKS